mmetsp:Transcript_12779/g.19221  ORF Transcript_12779/g.19221 Transcript_12779/m.19221 type:complete len:229 (-) Transcript_12779:1480-2166(-)
MVDIESILLQSMFLLDIQLDRMLDLDSNTQLHTWYSYRILVWMYTLVYMLVVVDQLLHSSILLDMVYIQIDLLKNRILLHNLLLCILLEMDNMFLVGIMNMILVLLQKRFLLDMGFHYLSLDLDSKILVYMLYILFELLLMLHNIHLGTVLNLFHHNSDLLDMDYMLCLLLVSMFRLHNLLVWMMHHMTSLLDMIGIQNLLLVNILMIHMVLVRYPNHMSILLGIVDM